MNILKFAEEFTHLIIRYKRTPLLNNDPSNTIISLTDEEIVYTIHHVLEAISIRGFNHNNNITMSEISHNTNIATVPETLNIKHESDTDGNNFMLRSQDVQSVCTDDGSCIFEISPKAIKQEQEDSFNKLQKEKKFISQSNPAICNNISRSNTFICEEIPKINREDQDIFEDFTNAETDDFSNNFQVLLCEIKQSTMDIMAKLINLEESFLQSRKSSKKVMVLPKKVMVSPKVQQQSLIKGYSSPNCTSIRNKAKISINPRKLSSTPKTLTSSKLLIKNENIFERRESTGGIGINTSVKKSEESKVTSNMNLTICNKTSPGLSVEFKPKFTKNPKYAHIQSTIPKALGQKKKTK